MKTMKATKKPLNQKKLLAKAQLVFNKFIRTRDAGKPCVSCGSFNTAHASHFYAAGSYSGLRFNPDNCHLSCVSCNTYKHGNIHEYRVRLIERIGQERVQKLDQEARLHRLKKWHPTELQNIIDTYKTK